MHKSIPPPDINDVKQKIQKLENIDVFRETDENLYSYVKELMNGYSVHGIVLNSLCLYRGIKFEEKPNFYKNLIYPPEDKTILTRAGYEKEQVFYATSSKRAVFYELKVQAGDKLIVGEWTTNEALLFNSVGYTETNLHVMGSSREFENEKDERGTNGANQAIADYLAKSFCQDICVKTNYLYKLTNAIARVHLSNANDKMFSGLIYPTIQFRANEDNFAIRKNTIDKGLFDINAIHFIEILEVKENRYKYRTIDQADEINNNGNIKWKNLDKKWTRFDDSEDIVFVSENGDVLAYNENGDIIAPD
jgi:hypothetical protein